MLTIMEAGMADGIVILPVHDGCLCQRQHKENVLKYFADQSIEVAENKDHLKPIPIQEAKSAISLSC